MFSKLILAFALGMFGLCQPVLAITVINQTDSSKTIKIEEAYRPTPDKPGDLAAPVSLGHPSEEIEIPAHSAQIIPLKANASVLLVTMISEKRDGKQFSRIESKTCYEPYDLQNQQECYFTDDWGFIIHKPIERTQTSFSSRDHLKRWKLEMDKKQGYGIKCLHPLLLAKVTSLEELPEDL